MLQSKKLLTNHKGDFTFKPGGLIKKTISIKVGGHPHHLICYYDKQDFCYAHLGHGRTKTDISPFNAELLAEIRRIKIPEELLAQQSFRKPVSLNIEPGTVGLPPDTVNDPFTASAETPKGKKILAKRRSSFPGALPTSRMKRDPNNDPFYFVPIAPAEDSLPNLEGPFMPFQANLQAIPESSNNLGCIDIMAGLYQPETPTRNSFKDDLAAMATMYQSPTYNNGDGGTLDFRSVHPNEDTENDAKEGLKWSNWFNSPEQAQFKANQEFFRQTRASPVLHEDPMLAPVRPPSLLLEIDGKSNGTS